MSLKMDFGTLVGVGLAAGSIVGGLILEGGSPKDIGQMTAALIVMGGTVGAVLVNTPLPIFMGGMRRLRQVFLAEPDILPATVETLVHYATQARKGGIVSLEDDVALIADPFLRKALTLAVDGTDMDELRAMMELQIALEEHRAEAEAKVFESAGGYSPTIGIIGAVMGLIQVMKHLENIEEVGHGIAVAFVATVYGVAAANLLFLPAANKMKARGQEELQRKELMLEGVISIVEGLNPKLVRSKLSAYVQGPAGKGAGAASQPGKQGGEHAATVEAEA